MKPWSTPTLNSKGKQPTSTREPPTLPIGVSSTTVIRLKPQPASTKPGGRYRTGFMGRLPPRLSAEGGFTLIETLVTMLILLVMLAAIQRVLFAGFTTFMFGQLSCPNMNVVNPAKSTRWIAASITSRMSMVTRVSISVKPPSALRRGRRRPMKPVRCLLPGLVDAGCGFIRISVGVGGEALPIGRVVGIGGQYPVLVSRVPFEMGVVVLQVGCFICGNGVQDRPYQLPLVSRLRHHVSVDEVQVGVREACFGLGCPRQGDGTPGGG